MSAALTGQLEVARFLIEQGARVDACLSDVGKLNGYTVLMSAAQNGQLEVLELLLANGSDMGAKTEGGKVALMLAAKKNHWNVVKKLI